MSLQLILGNSGGGKSRFLNQKLLQMAKDNPAKNILLIVPEQFTLQTQKELVRLHEKHSILQIDILSFQRLAYRVFAELGTNTCKVLEEEGKNLILRKVAEEKKDQLKVLQGNITRMGYISEVKSLISEMTQYNITPDLLQKEVQSLPEGNFRAKLNDLYCMYEGFREAIEGNYITAEEILSLLIDVADESNILKDSIIALDGFTGFTPIQNRLLLSLMRLSSSLCVTVTIDSRENPFHGKGQQDLFAMSRQTVKSLVDMAALAHCEVEEPIWIAEGASARFQYKKRLFYLEQNLFRSRKTIGPVPKDDQSVQLFALQNPREELAFTARKIKELVQSSEFRYQDIALVCADLSIYGNYAGEVFEEYQIPVFLDQKVNVLFHPFVEFVRAVPQVILMDFSYESVFRYLRSGFSGLSQADTDRLENYILAAGIRGSKKWSERFAYQPRGYGEEELAIVNQSREYVYRQFEILASWRQEQSVLSMCQTLYRFFLQNECEQQIYERRIKAEQCGDQRAVKEYEQIYRIIIDLLDKMASLIGEEIISADEFCKILDSGLEAAKIGIIPPGQDRVMIGDIERSRLDHIKILFVVGINDGSIPKTSGSDGILTQLEREKLAEDELTLAPTAREKSFIQKFYLYLMLTKPSHSLYLTYSRVNGEGKGIRRSYLIGSILKIFPDLAVSEVREESLLERIVTPENSFLLFVEELGRAIDGKWEPNGEEASDEKTWAALCRWYFDQPDWKEKADQLLHAAQFTYEPQAISKAVATALYGSQMENSVTRLEKFAACAYAHYLTYGLSLQERLLHQFEAVDMGNIFHGVLEEYAHILRSRKLSWFTVSEEMTELVLAEAVESAMAKNHNLALYEDARSLYMKKRMFRILRRTVWAITQQIRQGSFEPAHFELSFQYAEDMESVRFLLGEEETMHLRGRIDRIDTMEDEEQIYVKVVDYKSGNTSFQFLNIYHGLQLQLVVYMNAALEIMEKESNGKTVIPAGIFYSHLKDPLVEADTDLSEEELKSRILKEFRLDGLVNSNRLIYEQMDRTLEGQVSTNSDILPIGINKDGTLKKASKVANTQGFRILSGYVSHMIESLGQRILSGDIGIVPYQLADRTACDYCDFQAVCQFDVRVPGFEYRKLKNLSEDEILEYMKGDTEDGISMDEGTKAGH